MSDINPADASLEVHDSEILAQARAVLDEICEINLELLRRREELE